MSSPPVGSKSAPSELAQARTTISRLRTENELLRASLSPSASLSTTPLLVKKGQGIRASSVTKQSQQQTPNRYSSPANFNISPVSAITPTLVPPSTIQKRNRSISFETPLSNSSSLSTFTAFSNAKQTLVQPHQPHSRSRSRSQSHSNSNKALRSRSNSGRTPLKFLKAAAKSAAVKQSLSPNNGSSGYFSSSGKRGDDMNMNINMNMNMNMNMNDGDSENNDSTTSDNAVRRTKDLVNKIFEKSPSGRFSDDEEGGGSDDDNDIPQGDEAASDATSSSRGIGDLDIQQHHPGAQQSQQPLANTFTHPKLNMLSELSSTFLVGRSVVTLQSFWRMVKAKQLVTHRRDEERRLESVVERKIVSLLTDDDDDGDDNADYDADYDYEYNDKSSPPPGDGARSDDNDNDNNNNDGDHHHVNKLNSTKNRSNSHVSQITEQIEERIRSQTSDTSKGSSRVDSRTLIKEARHSKRKSQATIASLQDSLASANSSLVLLHGEAEEKMRLLGENSANEMDAMRKMYEEKLSELEERLKPGHLETQLREEMTVLTKFYEAALATKDSKRAQKIAALTNEHSLHLERQREDIARKNDQLIKRMVVSHENAIAELKEDKANLRRDFDERLAEEESRRTEEINALEERSREKDKSWEKTLAIAEGKQRKEIETIIKNNAQATVTQNASHSAEIVSLKEKAANEIENARRDLANATIDADNTISEHSLEISALKASFERSEQSSHADMDKVKKKHAREIEKLQVEFTKVQKSMQLDHDAEVARIREENDVELSRIRTTKEDLRGEWEADVKAVRAECDHDLSANKSKHALAIKKLQSALDAAASRHSDELSSVKAHHHSTLNTLRAEKVELASAHAATILELNTKHDEFILKIKDENAAEMQNVVRKSKEESKRREREIMKAREDAKRDVDKCSSEYANLLSSKEKAHADVIATAEINHRDAINALRADNELAIEQQIGLRSALKQQVRELVCHESGQVQPTCIVPTILTRAFVFSYARPFRALVVLRSRLGRCCHAAATLLPRCCHACLVSSRFVSSRFVSSLLTA